MQKSQVCKPQTAKNDNVLSHYKCKSLCLLFGDCTYFQTNENAFTLMLKQKKQSGTLRYSKITVMIELYNIHPKEDIHNKKNIE